MLFIHRVLQFLNRDDCANMYSLSHSQTEKDATVSSDYAGSNGLISVLLIGKDVEGSGRGLM